jgi:hypothetical protein
MEKIKMAISVRRTTQKVLLDLCSLVTSKISAS